MQDDNIEPTKLKEVVEVVTTAKLMTEVVTTASATITAADTLITAAALTLTTAPTSQTNDKTDLGSNTLVFTSSMFDCDEMFTSESDVSLPLRLIYDRGIISNKDADEDVTLKDVADIAKEVAIDAKIEESADAQGRQAESQA
nr:hypothetical protein [Tanacetum cinerariifolium]